MCVCGGGGGLVCVWGGDGVWGRGGGAGREGRGRNIFGHRGFFLLKMRKRI